jgi:hypothetical protein
MTELIKLIKQLADLRFFGELLIMFEAGKVVKENKLPSLAFFYAQKGVRIV